MPKATPIEERLRAVERALGDAPAAETPDGPGTHRGASRGDELEQRLDGVEDRLDELEAGLQAVRGYVSNLDHVNETVERRANAAIAAVERMDSQPRVPPKLAHAQRPADLSKRDRDGRSADGDHHPETDDTDGSRSEYDGYRADSRDDNPVDGPADDREADGSSIVESLRAMV